MKIYRMKNNDFAFTAAPCTLANCTPGHIRLSDGPIYYPTSHHRDKAYSTRRVFASKDDADKAKMKKVRITRDGFSLTVESAKAAGEFLGCSGPNVSMAIRRGGTCAGLDGLRYSVELA
jgi:hypothetical protein